MNKKTVVKMKVSSIIKKFNKTYSIIIIPNTKDNVKKLSIKAPLVKILFTLLVILSLSITVFINSSQKVSGEVKIEEVSNEALQQQLQNLSQIIVEQNKSLDLSNSQIETLKANDAVSKDKINKFTEMYTKISSNYISKTNRGSTTKSSSSKTISDLMELNSVVEELNKNFNVDEKLKLELEISSENLKKFVDAVPTLIPAYGKISSTFGIRNHPITKVDTAHKGVDIAASMGDPILAAASGVVEYSGYSKGYGNNVIIDHKNGYRTIYGHSSKLLVKKGELVKKGQTIALVGSTGVSTGPHLHFEIRIDNIAVDPTAYVDFSNVK
ncbi:MAG TPA: M23 family metallopeptidase [Ruminiclostridium sp.]